MKRPEQTLTNDQQVALHAVELIWNTYHRPAIIYFRREAACELSRMGLVVQVLDSDIPPGNHAYRPAWSIGEDFDWGDALVRKKSKPSRDWTALGWRRMEYGSPGIPGT